MKIAQIVAVHPELSKEFGYVGRWRGEWEWFMSSVFWSFVLSSFAIERVGIYIASWSWWTIPKKTIRKFLLSGHSHMVVDR